MAILTNERRDQFWREINSVIDRYPELFDGMNDAFDHHHEGCDCNDDKEPYDPDSPKMAQAMVLLFSPKNLQGYETMAVFTPREQSSYMTDGLIAYATRR